MNLKTHTLAFAALLLLTACSGSDKTTNADSTAQGEQAQPTQIYTTKAQKENGTVHTPIGNYAFTTTLSAADSLPIVSTEYGNLYRDNIATLHITLDGANIINRTFTKQSFAQFVPKDQEGLALVSLIKDPDRPNELAFLATVGAPDDEERNFFVEITVNPNGNVTLAKTEPKETISDYDNLNIDPDTLGGV